MSSSIRDARKTSLIIHISRDTTAEIVSCDTQRSKRSNQFFSEKLAICGYLVKNNEICEQTDDIRQIVHLIYLRLLIVMMQHFRFSTQKSPFEVNLENWQFHFGCGFYKFWIENMFDDTTLKGFFYHIYSDMIVFPRMSFTWFLFSNKLGMLVSDMLLKTILVKL